MVSLGRSINQPKSIMRKNLQALLLTLAFAAFLCGCATPTNDNVIRIAVSQSNLEAQRMYQVTPFRSDDGKLWMAGNHWVWDAKTTVDGHEMTAKVTFDRNDAVVLVQVYRH
jgi:hypothetical protein